MGEISFDINNIFLFAEYIWPVSTYYDHLGKKHCFRKYFYLGSLGIINENDSTILLAHSPEHKKISFYPYYETIVVECYDNDNGIIWKLFSFSGLPLFADTLFKSFDDVNKKMTEYRKSWEK